MIPEETPDLVPELRRGKIALMKLANGAGHLSQEQRVCLKAIEAVDTVAKHLLDGTERHNFLYINTTDL